ncbi:MAG: DNA-deoxyinosine glycosylase [Hyphomonas sp.]|nr:DNA-deoxyinosine glycosylase [Hyphomonas sp.]
MIARSFAPIAAADARILILGSMPGVASLEAGEDYAHPRNAFWPIMGALYGAGPDLPYAERMSVLRASGVAVWDVLQSCVREGSLDADIRAEVPNNFDAFFAAHPDIRRIGLNGGKAAASFRKYAVHYLPAAVEVRVLPSTSPAHAARTLEAKCVLWRAALLS